jgi:esterase/lipase superfamily enzyme
MVDGMNPWLNSFAILAVLGLGFCQSAEANPADDIKIYAAAVDKGDWNAASAATGRLLATPDETFQLTPGERTELLAVAAEAAERAGDISKAISLGRKLIAEIETREGSTSYALVEPLRKLAVLLVKQGKLEDASSAYDRAVQISEIELGTSNAALLPIYAGRRAIDQTRLSNAVKNKADNIDELRARLASQDVAIRKLEAVAQQDAANFKKAVEDARDVRKMLRARDPDNAAFEIVPVFYGTNRAPTGIADPVQSYGVQRGPLVLGIAIVSVPKARATGEIPEPQVWRGDFRPDAAKHFVLTKVGPATSAEAFADSARAQINQSKRREALVFIHGFNSDFQDSAFRSAQLAVDLKIDGAVFMYDWPSKGSLFGYVADGAEVIRPMVRSLRDFLDIVVRKTGAERIHVVAHSMGNRYLLDALELMSRDTTAADRKPVFQQMIFAAPDVDADDFAERVKELGWMAQRMTLYASSKDRALGLSSTINGGYRRAGDATAAVTVDGLDTVDTTDVSAGGLGHGDFANRALDDLRAVVWLSLQPSSRCLLVKKLLPTGGQFWRLSGDQIKTCPYEAFQSAISLERALGPAAALKFVLDKIGTARTEKNHSAEDLYSAVLALFDTVK